LSTPASQQLRLLAAARCAAAMLQQQALWQQQSWKQSHSAWPQQQLARQRVVP